METPEPINSILPAGYPQVVAQPVYGCPTPPNFGFDKKATQDDSDEGGLVKRGIIEDPNEQGSADDGFVMPANPREQ